MRHVKVLFISLLVVFTIGVLSPWSALAQTKYPRPETYIPTWAEMESHKRFYNDPRPFVKEFGIKQILPKEMYDKVTFDQEKMKALWSELVGFKAPDVVGKVHPEIKPGKYTYKDVQNNPAWKELLPPQLYGRIHPPGGAHVASFQEFELIPTRQYYWALPIAEMTKKNLGKVKQDAKGYLVTNSWEGGFPFPKPTGQFKAQQVMYNFEKETSYFYWNACQYYISRLVGYNSSRKVDFDGKFFARDLALSGRALFEPYGFYDSRAKQLGELDQSVMYFEAPRDQAGQLVQTTRYLDPEKTNHTLVYIPAFRRVRKMSGTDTQDPISGQDCIYDDSHQFSQKLTPNRYPYKYEIVAETERIVVAPTLDGAEYLDGTTFEYKNIKMERRPVYVVKLTQLDKNYVYGSRMLYIDKEIFLNHQLESFDQRGRLYRVNSFGVTWFPEAGMMAWWGNQNAAFDHIDNHTTLQLPWGIPAVWTRDDLRITGSKGQK